MANEFKIKKGLIVTGADGGTVVDVQGSQGQLFSVTDDLSGSIFAVSDISGVPILDVNSSGLSTFDGNVNLPDNKKILLGTGNDLEIYHDGSHSYINDAGTGALKILASQFEINNAANTENIATFTQDGAVSLFYNNVLKLATTSSGVSVTGDINQGAMYYQDGGGAGRIGFNRNTTNGVIHDANYNAFQFNGATTSGVNGNFEIQSYNQSGVFGGSITISKTSDLTTSSQVFSAATSSGDASSTLTTKGYVDGLITGATIYRGAWDPSGGGYGSPDLSGVTQTSGYYYICSAAGTAEPNGTGCEPDSWETGDWVIWNDDIVDCAGTGTGGWQKIDNSSVLSGVGTGQTVALWEGAGSVTDSETLGNAPITVSGNDTTFAGGVSIATDAGLVATAPIFNTGTGSRAMYIRGNNIVQFQNTTGVNKWEVVGREGQYYVYKNDGTGSGMKYQINTNGDHTFTGTVTLASGALNLSGTGRIQGVDTVTDSTDAANKAYVDTTTGAYLPLAAGSGSSLTDNLYINDVDQNNDNRYGNLRSEVGFTRSPVTGNPNQWFKVVALSGSPKRIKFSIIATGDNTNSYDNFLISTSGYGMNMHIEKLPGGRYNTSKLLSVAVINPSNSGGVEIWIKLGPVSSGTGATYVACTSDVLASATILASATTTAPTLTSNDTQLDISGDNRNYATIQTSRGATFGAKVGIGTNAPAAMLTVAGDSTISGNVGIGTTSTSYALDVEAGDTGNAVGDATTAAIFRAGRQNVWFQNQRTVAGTDWNNNTFKIIAKIDTTSHQSINFVNDASFNEHIDIYTGNQVFNTRFNANGNVGIGTTSNSAEETNNGVPKLQVTTTTAVLGEFPLAARFTTASDAGDNSGVSVLINSGNDRGLMISAGRAVDNRTRATLNLVSFDGTELIDGLSLYMPNTGSTGATTGTNVGIGTTSPRDTLEIVGNMRFVDGEDHLMIKPNHTIHGADFIVGDGVATTDTPVMSLNGLYGGQVTIQTQGSSIADKTVLDVQGTQGQLFSVTDDLSGSIFAVADISGVPIFDVNSSGVSYFDGNVGIGTDSPDSKLDVKGPSATPADGNQTLSITNSTGGTQLNLGTAENSYGWIEAREGSTLRNLLINPNGGNVGIGTISPTAKLNIGSAYNDAFVLTDGRTAGNTSTFDSSIVWDAFYSDAAKITLTHNDFSTTYRRLHFDIGGNELMSIKSNGNVGIGVTAPLVKLHVNQGNVSGTVIKATGIQAQIEIQTSTAGDAHLYMRPNTSSNKAAIFKMTAGTNYNWRWQDDATTPVVFMQLSQSNSSLSVKGDIIAYGSPSDERYKENIKPIESALDKAVKLQGVTFDWKESDSILDIKEDIGFIAQDVQKVVPELVRENEDGKLSLRYQGVTPILLEAIKELKAEIDLLKSKPCNCNNCNCSI